MTLPYRGRFAPSPTGPLHFGSLLTALASYLEAKARGGQWLVRIEDVDLPRALPGAADGILRTLEHLGFAWDGPVLYQSRRTDAYAAALDQLKQGRLLYPCSCSRREIARDARLYGEDGAAIYPGTCRHVRHCQNRQVAWRLTVADETIEFVDGVQGPITQHLGREVGDFVLERADGLHAYQLAVTVDDEFQGVSDVVRGADLLMSTPRQICLQRCLGFTTPKYFHLPVVTNARGEKWSKQTLAPAIDLSSSPRLLAHALSFLGQPVPEDLAGQTLSDVWAWAMEHWSLARVPRRRQICDETWVSLSGHR